MSASVLGPVCEVELRFPAPDRDLAATLALPDGARTFPAAVLVSGSGPLDRNLNAPKLTIDSTRQLAHAPAAAAFSALAARPEADRSTCS